ncbi:MAG: tRNA glutamyl-Q(34) synthetase GluQRS, partial [Clostridiales bacterium]|nr:tRNA glutamyl-Q(34) synthetase GluQRS [Clostridiales bacterium]
EDIIELLGVFGMKRDEPIIYQSERTEAYSAAEDRLRREAELYPCFCTRAELHSDGVVALPDGGILYPQTCRSLSNADIAARMKKEQPSIRLAVPDEVIKFHDGIFGAQAQELARECGDFVIKRRDGIYSYQLAVVVDDGYSGVTEVVRGSDLLYDTPRQIYLQRLLGLPEPEYYHIPLVVNGNGKKLSKSDGDSAARLLKFKTAEQIIGALAHAAGIADEPRPTTIDGLIHLYSADKISRSDIILPQSLEIR